MSKHFRSSILNRRTFLQGSLLLCYGGFGLLACTKTADSGAAPAGAAASSAEAGDAPEGYYTCSMHPQIHLHSPGKCPICGMPLILVKSTAASKSSSKPDDSSVEVSETQQKNSRLAKATVERKDLLLSLSVSGRVLSAKEIAFQVYESDLAQIKIGMEFTGSPTTSPEQILRGKISSIDSLVDPTSRTIRVTGSLNSSAKLSAEGGFQAQIESLLKNQIVINEDAVLHSGTKDLVYVFSSNNSLTARAVQLGVKSQNQYQILTGLKEGEVISAGPNFLIDSEAKLRGQFK